MASAATGCVLLPSNPIDLPDGTPSSSGDTKTTYGTYSSAAACTNGKDFAKAQCDRAARCATDEYWYWGLGTGEQCEHYVASVYVGLFTFTGKDERFDACEKELQADGCGPTPSCESLSREKRREEGVECSSGNDCKVGLTCIASKCAPRLAEGAECRNGDQCNDGLACNEDGLCKPVVDGTSACHSNDDCAVTRDGGGGYWLLTSDSDRFYCDDSTLKCRAVTRTRTQGESCSNGQLCVEGTYCKGRLLHGEGTCAPTIKYGESCESLEGCPSCKDGICKDPLEGVCK